MALPRRPGMLPGHCALGPLDILDRNSHQVRPRPRLVALLASVEVARPILPACCGCLVLPCPCLAALLPPVACGCLPRLDSCPERPPGAPGLCPAAFGRFQPGYNPHRLPVILPPPLDRSQLLGIQDPMPAPWNGRGPGCSWRVKRESA